MYSLSEDLHRLVKVFEDANVTYEVIGGVAVNAHLLAAGERGRAFLTRDIDALLKREDMDRLIHTAKEAGYEGKRIIAGFALLLPGQKLSEAVHLLFVGEKRKSSYPVPNPDLSPEIKDLFDLRLPVAPLKDLLIMKLNSFRPKISFTCKSSTRSA